MWMGRNIVGFLEALLEASLALEHTSASISDELVELMYDALARLLMPPYSSPDLPQLRA